MTLIKTSFSVSRERLLGVQITLIEDHIEIEYLDTKTKTKKARAIRSTGFYLFE